MVPLPPPESVTSATVSQAGVQGGAGSDGTFVPLGGAGGAVWSPRAVAGRFAAS